jgi:hypothetical protein
MVAVAFTIGIVASIVADRRDPDATPSARSGPAVRRATGRRTQTRHPRTAPRPRGDQELVQFLGVGFELDFFFAEVVLVTCHGA